MLRLAIVAMILTGCHGFKRAASPKYGMIQAVATYMSTRAPSSNRSPSSSGRSPKPPKSYYKPIENRPRSNQESRVNSFDRSERTSSTVENKEFPPAEYPDKCVILERGKARLFQDGNPVVYNGAVKEVVST